MKLPKSIIVKGKKWKTRYKKDPRLNRSQVDGLCELDKRAIALRSNMDEDRKKIILMHEIIHAIVFEYFISLDPAVEEQICDAFSNEFFELFNIELK